MLTHNRDEKKARGAVASLPKVIQKKSCELIAPIDQKALGTWIFTKNTGITACLLNGAFEKHQVKESYSRSRGSIIFELAEALDAERFLQEVDLKGVEPFTLIILDRSNKNQIKLIELRWDEVHKHITPLDSSKPHLWSSATLYTREVHRKRTDLFLNWLEEYFLEEKTPILNFHQRGQHEMVETPIWLKSDTIFTVSTCLLYATNSQIEFRYLDYLNNNEEKLSLKL